MLPGALQGRFTGGHFRPSIVKGADVVSSTERSEARSVILRLRRYRDRIEEITTAAGDRGQPGGADSNSVQRKLTALKTDLDHDVHECGVGRKRSAQTECEQRYLWPALRDAAGAMRENKHPYPLDPRSHSELGIARTHILHYLGQLEGLYPRL